MKNYICIQSQKIELTEEQVNEIKASLGVPGTKLSDVPVGDTVKIGKHEMIVLQHSVTTTTLIRKDLLVDEQEFGKNNNYNGSYVDAKCNEFADEIADIVGAENMIEFTVDLTADDGLKNYGRIERKAALLTAEQYRRYVEILDKYKLDNWWWLATAHSTAKHGSSSWVKCVAPSGFINFSLYFNYYGVRPFCILKSNIFVSV